MEKPKKLKKKVQNDPLVVEMSTRAPQKSDPFGSYTGQPINPNETPVQDADDL